MTKRITTMVLGTALTALAVCSAQAAPVLTAADVKALFEQTAHKGCSLAWHSVQIAGARPASVGEISAAGMPPHAVVTPVRVDYTEACHPGYTRDHRWNYYFFKDDFGKWTKQSNAMPGNYESEPR